jgi:hypothetical protein
MCESIVVVGAALYADVYAPTERVHSRAANSSRSIARPETERGVRPSRYCINFPSASYISSGPASSWSR